MGSPESPATFHPRLHLLALVASSFTFLLILPTGALVTSTGSSLAVPDWPLSFGQFFPPMVGGVLFEHGHRLTVAAVSTLLLSLFAATLWVERRPRVKALAFAMVGALVTQAVLGGMTVRHFLPPSLSISHAGLAQITFCLTAAMALVTSRSWLEETPHRLSDRPSPLRLWSLGTTVVLYTQILLGAVTRHSGAGLAIPDFPLSFGSLIPNSESPLVWLQFAHTRVGALAVLVLVTHTSFRVCSYFPEEKGLFWPAATAGLLVWLQCFLGILILFTQKAVVPTSIHLVIGAAILASQLLLTLKCFQLFKKGSPV